MTRRLPASASDAAWNISPTGVGLVHENRIDSPQFWLHLELFNGETISVLVERLWQHHLPHGPYQSGGRFMEIAATNCAEERSATVRAAEPDGHHCVPYVSPTYPCAADATEPFEVA
jgi:hypothetical protein